MCDRGGRRRHDQRRVVDVKRGDVWWAETPEMRRRPVLILTRSEAIDVVSKVLVAPATTTIRGIPSELAVDRADGMPKESAFSFDNITVVPKSMLTEQLCHLSHKMSAACSALAAATGC